MSAPAIRVMIWPRYEVQADGRPLRVSRQQAIILAAIRAGRGRPLTAEQLSETVWPDPDRMPDQWLAALDNSIFRLRRVLTAAGVDGHRVVSTTRGLGYRWGLA